MTKGRDGGKKTGRTGKKKRRMKIVATTSLPAVNRPNADRWTGTPHARAIVIGSGRRKRQSKLKSGFLVMSCSHLMFFDYPVVGV